MAFKTISELNKHKRFHNNNEEKRKMEEEELEQLLKEQKGEVEETTEETEPTNAEEKTFKKRYSDLRRHQQQQAEEFKQQIAELRTQLDSATKKEMKLPKSDEDIEQWAKNYPDVAAIVETIAMKKAREQSTEFEERVKMVDEIVAQFSGVGYCTLCCLF